MSSALIVKCNANVLKTVRNAVHRADTKTAYTVVPAQSAEGIGELFHALIQSTAGRAHHVAEYRERVEIDQSQEASKTIQKEIQSDEKISLEASGQSR